MGVEGEQSNCVELHSREDCREVGKYSIWVGLRLRPAVGLVALSVWRCWSVVAMVVVMWVLWAVGGGAAVGRELHGEIAVCFGTLARDIGAE